VVSSKLKKNVKLVKKKKINSMKKFKSSCNLSAEYPLIHNLRPDGSLIGSDSNKKTKVVEIVKNDHSSDSDIEWDQELEPYKIEGKYKKTLSQTSENLHQGKELSFDHTEDENEISHKLEESKHDQAEENNNNNNDVNILNDNNMENFIEY